MCIRDRAGAPSRPPLRRARPAAAASAEPSLAQTRVAIAGGGVGGLFAALCLLKKGFDVTVYERTDAFKRFGGPIQLASNALSTFHAVDPQLLARVMGKFTYTGTRACGIKDGLRSKGFAMGGDNLAYLWDPSVGADWYVRFPLKPCADLWNLPYTGVIDRPDLQEILLDACRALKPDFIRNGEAVLSYAQPAAPGGDGGVTLTLASGATAAADVLVGCDGIWSSVRSQMYGETRGELRKGGRERQGCTYSGYTVFAGETVLPLPDYYECGYKVYIGPKRYFVTSDVGGGRVQWYSFFATEPGMKRARSGWGADGGAGGASADGVVGYLKGLHAGWSDEVHAVLDATSDASIEQRDLYDRRPELFRSWSDGAVTLLGDAVHPMMPNLGQGGCQAIEDAYVLAETLAAALEPAALDALADVPGAPGADGGGLSASAARGAAVRGALQRYYKARIARASAVQILSRLASDLIINLFDTPWSPHDDKGTDWKSYLTFFWKPVLQYLVFPAQFAFLYAFAPSGRMGALPAQLEAAWKERHRAEAEAAFEHARGLGSATAAAQDGPKASFISE